MAEVRSEKTAEQIAEDRIPQAAETPSPRLDLGSLGLKQFPTIIGNLTQLQGLELSHNQLSALPESVGQLTQLQTLDRLAAWFTHSSRP